MAHGERAARVNGKKVACLRGHPYDDENTRVNQHARACRKCCAMHSKAYRGRMQKRRAARSQSEGAL